MDIDEIRRQMILRFSSSGVSVERIGEMVGMIAEHNQCIHMRAYGKGYNDGYYAGYEAACQTVGVPVPLAMRRAKK